MISIIFINLNNASYDNKYYKKRKFSVAALCNVILFLHKNEYIYIYVMMSYL